MNIIHKVAMDLVRRSTVPRLDAVQGDQNTRMIEIHLYANGVAWAIPAGTSVSMRYRKTDGTKGYYDTLPDGTVAYSISENILFVTLAPQMLTSSGPVAAQIEMVQDANILSTFSILIDVEENPAAGVLESEDYINWLQWMGNELEQRLMQAKESGDFDGKDGTSVTHEWEGTVLKITSASGTTSSDLKGEKGDPADPRTINSIEPDENGNIVLTAASVGALAKTGDTMTGPLVVPAPTESGHAVNKGYVDTQTVAVTLLADAWEGDSAPYSQTVTVAGLTDAKTAHGSPAYSGTQDEMLAMREACGCVSYAERSGEEVTFWCLEDKPAADIDMTVEVGV